MKHPEVIVSVASYPPRIDAAVDALEPLLRQTVPPDRILLWLPSKEFEEAGVALPKEIADMERRVPSFEIKWVEASLRPHNKYFWAMRQHPEAIVITVDDDIVYPLTLVQNLLEAHYRHPHAVVASRSHLVKVGEDGEIAPYDQWLMEQKLHLEAPRHDLLATGVGGVLYPPCVFDEEVFDEQGIRNSSLLADDLWLQAHEVRLGVPVVNAQATFPLWYIPGSQDAGLYVENLCNGRNDVILKALLERYPAVKEKLVESAAGNEASAPLPAEPAAPEPSAGGLGSVARLKRKLGIFSQRAGQGHRNGSAVLL